MRLIAIFRGARSLPEERLIRLNLLPYVSFRTFNQSFLTWDIIFLDATLAFGKHWILESRSEGIGMTGAENGQNGEDVPWLQRLSPGSGRAYAFAAFLVVIATLVSWGVGLLGEDVFVFAAYYPGVLFATYVGGAGAGAFATVLSAVIAWRAFMPSAITPGLETELLAFLLASALIVWGADHYRRLKKRLEDEEAFRKLAVEELSHRLKNKIATIQSIVSFQLRDNPQSRDAIVSRLMALSATDDLILATQGQGATIRDILSAELGPHDVSRVSMAGPDVFLGPKLALTMALLFHELATNAAKHGALSCEAGQVGIRWSLCEERLSLEWRERNGPTVATPLSHGFGMRLLSRALDQFGGAVETTFVPTGFICRMNVALLDDRPDIVPEETRQAAE